MGDMTVKILIKNEDIIHYTAEVREILKGLVHPPVMIDERPNGARMNLYRPKGVMKVVRSWLSLSNGHW